MKKPSDAIKVDPEVITELELQFYEIAYNLVNTCGMTIEEAGEIAELAMNIHVMENFKNELEAACGG